MGRHPANRFYDRESDIGTADAEAEIYGSKSETPKCSLTLSDGTVLDFDDREVRGPNLYPEHKGMSRERLEEILEEFGAECRRRMG